MANNVMPYVLHVNKLCKVMKGKALVQNVSFTIHAGQILALCGGNGAGKSTVLRMVAGIMLPTSGEVSVNGQSPTSKRTRFAEQIGYMPDDFRFSHSLSAEETLQFWADLKNVGTDRVIDVLDMVGLGNHKKQRVTTFSKGMRQRLLFAQAVLSKPPLLIMDEPTNGLDPYWMQEFAQLMKSIRAEGQMVVFSTHQLEIAEDVADEVVFLNQGQQADFGPTSRFRERFGTLHAAFRHSLGIK